MSLQHKEINNNFNTSFIILTDMQERDIHFLEEEKKQLVGWSELSQKWGRLCGVERYRGMGHIS